MYVCMHVDRRLKVGWTERQVNLCEASACACHLDWENVSTVHVCQFYLEERLSNCIVIMKSLFEGRRL